MSKTVSKHVIEIRYKPNSRFLDKRGEITEIISNDFFNHWNIANNRVDFMSKNNTNIGAFLSYRNLGLFSHHPNETKLFIEKAKEFIKSAWDYFPSNKITRIGVRSTYLTVASLAGYWQ